MTDVFATQVVHEVAGSGHIDGTATNGVGTEETIERGRIQVFTAGTKGGLFPAHARVGMRVEYVAWNLPTGGSPTITVSLVDGDNIVYKIESLAAGTGSLRFGSNGLFVPPGWKFKVESSLACTALGRVTVCVFRGWSQTLPGVIGTETLPG
jgi:hypothetical protein